ncbi:uncharacterized protein LOC115874223 [Sitophilus oryzae]|uniref:Uncharacterized protein LOC115874223 n=1 Tax=Sitophilus oryzae TaxID=7048 RepID=A0A6J2X1T2_SITOR|nr:uncharacterized protein LOC115874223 [Sitophilus oryzae]
MEVMLRRLKTEADKVGLSINIDKTKSMRINTNNNTQFNVGIKHVENVTEFTYLGSIVIANGGADADIVIRKAQRAFGQLKSVWTSRQLSIQTKLRIVNSNVIPVLLYGCETWRVTKISINRPQPDTIRNTDLLHLTNQQEVGIEIRKRKWSWIGHTLRKPDSNIARSALEWNPQGKRTQGRPAQTWRRSILDELQQLLGLTTSGRKA